MSLYREIMYSTAPVLRHHDQFYGAYTDLNSVKAPTNNEIASLQEAKLREYQRQAMINTKRVNKLNTFLKNNGNLSTSSNTFTQIINQHTEELFNQINALIGQGVMTKQFRGEIATNKKKEQDIIKKLTKLARKIEGLNKNLNAPISSRYIDELMKLVNDLPGADIDFILRTLYHLKGDILEEVGVAWLQERIPRNLDIQAVKTGSLQSKKGQLIQDIMMIDVKLVDLMADTEIKFTIGGGNKVQVLKIKDFLDKVKNYKGNKNIVITNESEHILRAFSVMGIQAKSGQNQLPWNVGSSNTHAAISGGQGGNCAQYIDFLNRIQGLYNTWDKDDHKNIKTQSAAYIAMANYTLASQLNKVLHLSSYENQYVLTPNGFVTYAERIADLYRKKGSGNYMLRFKGNIHMEKGGNMVNKMRPVIISGM